MFLARNSIFALCLVIVGACATSSGSPALPSEASLVYETRSPPFCGSCHVTKIVLTPTGEVWLEQGHWAGRYRDWRVTRRLMEVPPRDAALFRERLDGFRPDADLLLADSLCGTYDSDDGEIRIQWRDQRGAVSLIYDLGCDAELRADMRRALQTAPNLLGIRLPEFGQ